MLCLTIQRLSIPAWEFNFFTALDQIICSVRNSEMTDENYGTTNLRLKTSTCSILEVGIAILQAQNQVLPQLKY